MEAGQELHIKKPSFWSGTRELFNEHGGKVGTFRMLTLLSWRKAEGEAGDPCESRNNDPHEIVKGLPGECLNELWCLDNLCGQCTLTAAQEQMDFCFNPDTLAKLNRQWYNCSKMPDDCSNSENGGCPCCPSTGQLGCLFIQGDLNDAMDQPVTNDLQFLLEGSQEKSVLVPFILVDVPAGTYDYTIRKKGFKDYSGTVEVQGRRTAFVPLW